MAVCFSKKELIKMKIFLMGLVIVCSVTAFASSVEDDIDEITRKIPSSMTLEDKSTSLEKGSVTPLSKPKKERQTPQSAPTKQREKISDDNRTPTLKTKSRKAKTDPLPKKTKARTGNHLSEEIYKRQEKVSAKFLNFTKVIYPSSVKEKIENLLNSFKKECDKQKPYTLDITGLSSRTRIYLLTQVIHHKLAGLPEEFKNRGLKWQDFLNACKETNNTNNNVWKGQKFPNGDHWELVNKIPVYFKIGNFSYKFTNGVNFGQRGSGRLHGLISKDSAETYSKICEKLETYDEQKRENFSEILLRQKKDGLSISNQIEEDNRFLNGFNLLLDYEVARRLIEGDPYQKFPVVTYMNIIIKNLHDISFIKSLFLDKTLGKWNFSFDEVTSSVFPLKNLKLRESQ